MGETELERLVVRLVGDGAEYQAMLNQAQSSAKSAAKTIEGVGARFYQAGGGLRLFGERAVEAMQSLLIVGRLRKAFNEFAEAEAVTAKLTATVKANGREVEKTMRQYEAFAARVEMTTVLSDEGTMMLVRQAETYGLTGAAAEKAATDAIAFAGAVDGTAESAAQYLRLAVAMQKGDFESAKLAARYVRQLRGVKDAAEFTAKAQQLLASGQATVTAEAGTAAGALKQLRNIISNLMEDFGRTVAEGVMPFVQSLREFTLWFKALPAPVKQATVIIAGVAAALLLVAPAIAAIRFWAMFTFNPLIIILTAAAGALAIWVDKVGGVGKAIKIAKEWTAKFVKENENLIISLGLAGAAVGVVIFAFKTLQFLYTALHVQQMLSIAGWVAWTAAAVIAKVAALAFAVVVATLKVTLALFTAAITVMASVLAALPLPITLAIIALTFFFGKVVLVKAAVWLLNAAIAALAGPIAIIGGIFTGTFGGIAATITGVVGALAGIPTTFGAIKEIKGLFSGWLGIIKEVLSLMTTDMPAAWQLLQAGFRLAVEQIKALWPPLWALIKDGFSALWVIVSENLTLVFKKVSIEILKLIIQTLEALGVTAPAALSNLFVKLTEDVDKLQTTLPLKMAMAAHKMAAAFRNFKIPLTPGIEEAQKALNKLRDDLNEKGMIMWLLGDADGAKKAQKEIDKMNEKMKKVKQEAQKFDAALVGSAEAASRIAAYQDLIANAGKDGAALGKPGGMEVDEGGNGGNGDVAAKELERGNDLLAGILGEARKANQRPGLEVEAANLA